MKRNNPNGSEVTGSPETRAEGKGRPTGLPDPALYCTLHDTEWDPGERCQDCAWDAFDPKGLTNGI